MTTPTKQSNPTISQALEDFDKKFVRVKSGKWKLIGWDAEASEADFKSFLQSKLEEVVRGERQKLKGEVEGLKVITMIGPGRFGDGKPTQVPTSEFGKGYNKALRDLLEEHLIHRDIISLPCKK